MRLVYVLVFTVLSAAHAFQSVHRPLVLFQTSRGSALFDSKEEEIAKLEEQLKMLKEEKEPEEIVEKVKAIEEQLDETPVGMFLTEQWKEQDTSKESSKGGGLLGTILPVVGLALFLAFFAQIPVGQEDLSKYSVGSSPSTSLIDLGDLNRARNAGDL